MTMAPFYPRTINEKVTSRMCALMPTGLWSFKIKDTSSSVYVEPEFDYFVDLNLGLNLYMYFGEFFAADRFTDLMLKF